jgi:hypothetical protein
MVFLCALLYATAINAACGCYACLSGVCCALRYDPAVDSGVSTVVEPSAEPAVPFAEFRVVDRWTRTAASGFNNVRGNPIEVTWGIVADGTSITGSEGTSPSNLIAMLNTQYGAGSGGITSAPWFRLFEASFRRWDELSGVRFTFEPRDGGQPIDNTTTPSGSRGVYPDVRIGGHSIDGATGANTLAYNYFPDHSDMVLDTDNSAFYGNRDRDSIRLRNVLMHEAGHGLGFNHVDSTSASFLMEPFISAGFDGPQLDDILAVQRNYGDALEEAGGNDTTATATNAGLFAGGQSWEIGRNGDSTAVTPAQVDFVSIDGLDDTDLYRIAVAEPVVAELTLRQRGAIYQEGPQDGTQTSLDTRQLNDLALTFERQTSSVTNIVVASGVSLGSGLLGESVTGVTLLPGINYFARVRGTIDNVQLYGLRLSFTAVPEPSALAGGLALLSLAPGRRRVDSRRRAA